MRQLLSLFTLLVLLFSCGKEQAVDPLEAARQKLSEATSIAFTLNSVLNNTFINDTMVQPAQTGVYIRNDREGFPFDFLYRMDDYFLAYEGGKLKDVDLKKGRIVVYNEEEAKESLSYIGNQVTMLSPMEVVKDSAWTRAGSIRQIVFYERVLTDTISDDGHYFTVSRLYIDSVKSEIVSIEQLYSLNEEPQQHVVQSYTDFRFGEDEALNVSYPDALKEFTQAEVDGMRERKALEPGDEFPAFELMDINGESVTSSSVRGKKAVFVFSYIGCGGCEFARKELAKSEFQFSDEFVGLYVNPLNSAQQLKDYHKDKPWPFRMVATDYDFSERYGVYSYPTFITVNASGRVEEVVAGYDEDYFANKGTSL